MTEKPSRESSRSAASSCRYPVVAFDLDGTLLPGTAASLILAESMGHGGHSRELERRYHAYELSNREIVDIEAGWYAGAALEDVWQTLHGAPWIEGLEETLGTLAAAGCHLLLATIAWGFAADMLKARFPFHAVSGVEMAMAHGCLTGRITRYMDEADKRDFVRGWCARHGFDRRDVVAIGDSRSDVPLFGWAGMSIALNATAEARAVADVAVDTVDLRDLLPWLLPSVGDHGTCGRSAARSRRPDRGSELHRPSGEV